MNARTLLLSLGSCGALSAQHFELARHRQLPAPNLGTVVVASGDFDGDGDRDLVSVDGGLDLVWNNGEGKFVRAQPPLPLSPFASYFGVPIVVGDIDNDGDPDVLVGQSTWSTYNPQIPARLFRNDAGTLVDATATQWAANVGPTAKLRLVDFDGDGDLDLVTCCLSNPGDCGAMSWQPGALPNQIWLNDGTGRFTAAPARMPNNLAVNTDVAAGDVDLDGDADLVFSSMSSCAWVGPGMLRLFRQNSSGIAVEVPGAIAAAAGYWRSVVLFDRDNDGDLDLAAVNSYGTIALSGGVFFFDNVGNGTFVAAGSLLDSSAAALTVVDFDADGRSDLLLERRNLETGVESPRCLRNTPAGFVDVTGAVLAGADMRPSALHPFDADGDGDLDLLGSASPQSYLWWNDGAGHWVQPATPQMTGDTWLRSGQVQLADIDGDGDLDAAIVRRGRGNTDPCEVALTENEGEGPGFVRHYLPGTANGRAIALFDIDGDGDLDVHVSCHPGASAPLSQDRCFRNDGWVFVDITSSALPAPVGSHEVSVVDDLDGDGHPDLVLGSGNAVHILRGSAGGVFTGVSAWLPPVPVYGQVGAMALLDYDHDGDLDLVVGSNGLELLRNDLPAGFTVVPGALPWLATTQSVTACDVDRDGWLDLIVGSAGIAVFRNANGVFVDETATRMPAQSTSARSATAGDLDGDGWADLATFATGYSTFYCLRNLNGVFQPYPAAGDPSAVMGGVLPAIGDVDRDGDADLLSGRGLMRNRVRHLATVVPPRLGKHGELLLQSYAGAGPSPQLAALFLSTHRLPSPTPVPPLGTLVLDPAYAWLHSIAAFPPAGGDASVQFAVPTNPALLGSALFAQAIFSATGSVSGADWRLGSFTTIVVGS